MLGKLGLLSPIVLVVAYVYYNNYWPSLSPVISLKNGKLQGIVSLSREGKEYYEYLGIPYAKPPVGPELRFESPQPAEPWEGIRDASYYRSMCLQFETFVFDLVFGSEDCLYLNVFVPKSASHKPIPVMLYIHGGLFTTGSGGVAGPKKIIDEDVILVSINYRLGPLGFLNTGDGVVRGNMGLKDQNLALRWVHDNIEAFGGDPKRVTIFGESAGASSVNFHILSPKSKGLFWRAIHQSGTSLNFWALYRDVKEQAKVFAAKVTCPVDDSKEMVHCLKNLDIPTLLSTRPKLTDFSRQPLHTFVASIEVIQDENAFLTEEPLQALQNGRFNTVPVITGCNSNEGLMISSRMIFNSSRLKEAEEDWDNWAPAVLHYPKTLKNVTAKLRKFYFGEETKKTSTTDLIQDYTNLIGDRYFYHPVSKFAKLQSKYAPSYLYYYDHQGGFSTGEFVSTLDGYFHPFLNVLFGKIKKVFKTQILGQDVPHTGTSHGDEMGSLVSGHWAAEFWCSSQPNDYEVSRDFVKLWTDFAKDKKPLQFRGIKWPKISENSLKYLRISNNPALIDEPFEERLKFWDTLSIPHVR